METTPRNCLRCATVMEAGFIADHGLDGDGVANWHPGRARTKPVGLGAAAVLDQSKKKQITAYRCPKCGTLELVAQ
jgi:hypothetical protein